MFEPSDLIGQRIRRRPRGSPYYIILVVFIVVLAWHLLREMLS